jgi:hypothetical protein
LRSAERCAQQRGGLVRVLRGIDARVRRERGAAPEGEPRGLDPEGAREVFDDGELRAAPVVRRGRELARVADLATRAAIERACRAGDAGAFARTAAGDAAKRQQERHTARESLQHENKSTRTGSDEQALRYPLPPAARYKAPVTLEERIRFALRRSDLSARKLSRKAELSEGFLAYVFRTLRTDPNGTPFSVDNLRALARAAGVSSEWLITGSGSPDDPETQSAPSPSLDEHFVARPVFGSLPDWPDLLARAQEIAPHLPAWTWERLATMAPLLSAPPTPVMVAELAIWMHRHERVMRTTAQTGAHRTDR